MKSPKERIEGIIKVLNETYPRSHTALRFRTPLQILVATILSAQCTDERVNQITPYLFQKYKTATDFGNADPKELEEEIKPTGFFRNKTKSIISASKKIANEFGGHVPDNMKYLIRYKKELENELKKVKERITCIKSRKK